MNLMEWEVGIAGKPSVSQAFLPEQQVVQDAYCIATLPPVNA